MRRVWGRRADERSPLPATAFATERKAANPSNPAISLGGLTGSTGDSSLAHRGMEVTLFEGG